MDDLMQQLRQFVDERDWRQFHTPKNLATALCVEAAELAEIFQWLTPEQSRDLPPAKMDSLRDEVGDVMLYLMRLCDETGIDLLAAAKAKLDKNRVKYPAAQVRGKALKYNEYPEPGKA